MMLWETAERCGAVSADDVHQHYVSGEGGPREERQAIVADRVDQHGLAESKPGGPAESKPGGQKVLRGQPTSETRIR